MAVIRTNLAPDPFTTNAANFGGNAQFTHEIVPGFDGTGTAVEWTRVGSAAGRMDIKIPTMQNSTRYAVTFQIRTPQAMTGFIMSYRPDLTSGSGQSTASIGIIPAGVSTVQVDMITANFGYSGNSGIAFVSTSATVPAVGSKIAIEKIIMEEGTSTGPIFAGSTPSTLYRKYAWMGTANASPSTESTYDNAEDMMALASGRKMWFGTRQRFQAVPTPATGAVKSNTNYNESGTLENGGGWAVNSRASHANWAFDFPVQEAHGKRNLDVFREYQTGSWDWFGSSTSGFDRRNLLYFADPMNYDSNLFPPNWASPWLPYNGDWHWIGNFNTAFSTAANNYGMPPITPEFTVNNTPYTVPGSTRQYALIPIPPSHQLWWGWSGSRTGAAVMTARAVNSVTGATADFDKTPNSPTGAQRIGSVPISGTDYDYAMIYFNRTTAVASTARPVSMTAQLHQLGVTPNLNGNHQQGMGTTGAVFDGGANPEEYVMIDPTRNKPVHYKGLSFGMREIGGWL